MPPIKPKIQGMEKD